MVTKQDVANKAGVSTATVGRVISGKGYVSKEARERVEKAISTLNYRVVFLYIKKPSSFQQKTKVVIKKIAYKNV